MKKALVSIAIIGLLAALLALAFTAVVGIVGKVLFKPASSIGQAAPAVQPAQVPAAAEPVQRPNQAGGAEGFFPADYVLPSNFCASGINRFSLYTSAPDPCTVDQHSACRQETLPDGTYVEYVLLPSGAMVMTQRSQDGQLLKRLGASPLTKVQYFQEKNKIWFFSQENDALEQLTVLSEAFPNQADVISFDSSGRPTDCQCADGTLSCCGQKEYDFLGKPNTYCTMFPSDPVFCVITC